MPPVVSSSSPSTSCTSSIRRSTLPTCMGGRPSEGRSPRTRDGYPRSTSRGGRNQRARTRGRARRSRPFRKRELKDWRFDTHFKQCNRHIQKIIYISHLEDKSFESSLASFSPLRDPFCCLCRPSWTPSGSKRLSRSRSGTLGTRLKRGIWK